MQMRLPLNAIHWYVALPLLAFVAYKSFQSQKSGPNLLNTFFGLSAITFFFSLVFYGITPLVVPETSILLTYATIIGDALQFLALFWIWLAVARIYFPDRKGVMYVVAALDAIVICIGMWFSVQENLANPVIMQYVNGAWQIEFAFSRGYQLVTAVQYLSLPLIAARFLAQGWGTQDVAKKIRLFVLAILFLIVGGLYVLRPIFDFSANLNSTSYVLAAAFLLGVVFLFSAFWLQRRRQGAA